MRRGNGKSAVPGQRHSRHVWRWVLLVAAICALTVLLVIRFTPPDFAEPYAKIPVHDKTLIPFTTGFIIRPSARELAFYGWDGKQKWTADLGMPVPSIGNSEGAPYRAFEQSVWNEKFGFSMSLDGRYFALLYPSKKHFLLKVWHDGQRVVEHTATELISCATHYSNLSDICIRITNAGKVIIWFDGFERDYDPFYIFQGNRCTARGDAYGYSTWIVDMDGVTAFRSRYGSRDSSQIFRIQNHSGKLELITIDDIYDESNQICLFASQQYMEPDGYLFTLKGSRKVSPPDHQLCAHDPERITALTRTAREYAVIPLSGGKSWKLEVPGQTDAYEAYQIGMQGYFSLGSAGNAGYREQSLQHVTTNGRYIIAAYYKPYRAGGFINSFVHYPHMYQSYAAVYEAPGKRRCLFQADRWFTSRISPDGHTVVAISDIDSNPTNGPFECQLYRW
ncbi:MAG: hypothetical protein ACYDCO_12195 [Armatimonadota bacterium]